MHLHGVSELPSRERICADQLELLFPNKQIIRHLVLLNSMSLPINYGNEHSPHYRKVLKNATSAHQLVNAEGDDLYWTRMAYYRKSLVGAITLHIQHIQMEKGVATNPFYEVTILTLAVLPTFRRRGVASILMEETFRQCRQWGTIEISLHCQASNEAARVFYSRYNFVEVQFVPGHYANLRIAQPDAYKLKLNLPYSHNTGIDVVGSLWN